MSSTRQLATTPRVTPVHVVGVAATPFLPEHDAMLDELVFSAVHSALAECGLRKQDAGLSVLTSMDALDGRSISSGLTTMASGGFLNDAFRVEGDSGLAVIAAAQAVAAGDVEVAIAVGVHNPETRSADPDRRHAFTAHVSNLGFEPFFDRPIGLTSDAVYGLHAAHAVGRGDTDAQALAALAAEEINRGAGRSRSLRTTTLDADDVLASAPAAWPLHDLMLPAHSTGAVAVVLTSPARAGRTLGRSARLVGFGHATGSYTPGGGWFTDPGAPTRRAAASAYRQAGIVDPAAAIDLVELSAPSAALHGPYLEALGLADLAPERVNRSGGLRSNYPGLANGALRLLETVEGLEDTGDGRAVSHSVDTETGTVSEDVTVMVVEGV
jgi:acetyl-CoA acetyltransferase